MNIAFFLLPKTQVAYLNDHFTIRQALEKMRHHGYTAIPVLDEQGKYVGTVSEGDFLWHIVDLNRRLESYEMKDMEECLLKDILGEDKNPPVNIMTSIENLISHAMKQNFVPVVDDLDTFIGIVTRQDIIKYFAER